MSGPDEFADRLESVAADLDDWSFDLLRQAVADGATQRPPAERELAKARRAIEKAVVTLRNLSD